MPQNPDCELCSLHKQSRQVCSWGSGDGNGFIVNTAAGAQKEQATRLIYSILTDFGLEESYITSAAKCTPRRNQKPEPDQLKACKPYLLEEIAERKPQAILLLGAPAMKACIGKTGITEMNGQVVEKDGQTYVCAFDPGYILRDPSKESALRMAIGRYASVLGGSHSTELPKWRAIDREGIDEFLDEWAIATEVAYDTETTRLNWWEPTFKVRSIGFTLKGPGIIGESNWGLPLAAFDVLDFDHQKMLLEALSKATKGKTFVAFNGKFDNNCLQAYFGISFPLDEDSMLSHHLVDENSSHALKILSRQYLGAPDYDIPLDEKTGRKEIEPHRFPAYLRKLLGYQAADTSYTSGLRPLFAKKMDDQQRWLYHKVIMPAAKLFEKIEQNGLYVNIKALNKTADEAARKSADVLAQLNKIAGREINWNSPAQVGELLYGDLGLTPTIFTDKVNTETGKRDTPSTGEEALVDIDHPVAKLLEKYREHEKFQSTYVGVPQPDGTYVGGWRDFMVGPHLYLGTKLHGTVTGRYSGRLHQVPRDADVRACVTAPRGWRNFQLDLSQAELRTIAIVSGDPEMLACFHPDTATDIHWKTMCAAIEAGGGEYVDAIYDTAKLITKSKRRIDFTSALDLVKELTPEEGEKLWYPWKEARKKAKAINFGFCFKQQPAGFVVYAKKKYGFEPTIDEATEFFNAYFSLYRQLPNWHDRQIALAKMDGQVRNMAGRIRHLPGIYSSDRSVVAECERQAINAPIQGFIADYKAMIMLAIAKACPWEYLRITGEVHDSVLGWIREDMLDQIVPVMYQAAMNPPLARECGLDFPIPMETDIELGAWGAKDRIKWKPS